MSLRFMKCIYKYRTGQRLHATGRALSRIKKADASVVNTEDLKMHSHPSKDLDGFCQK